MSPDVPQDGSRAADGVPGRELPDNGGSSRDVAFFRIP